jgi:predicted MPP superfamily phosphohydrolase
MEHLPTARADGPLLRVLLAHAPDQIDWAQRHQFDLMLAGHTHGGQIRLPLLGAIVAPSRLGTKFSAGTFYMEPTVMHVSRGVSGLTPLRWNCPPEITRLVLRCGTTDEQTASVLAHASA